MKETFSLNSNFSLTHNDDGSTQLEGFAIHGADGFIVNGIFEVPESEMQNCAKSLKGAKLMKDHDTDHVDSIIGRVNAPKKTFDDGPAQMEGVHYNASLVVDDTNLSEKIEKGLIDATSIGFTFEPECSICGNPYFSGECEHFLWCDDMHLICRDMECHELSLVTFGADPHATVSGSLDAKSVDELKEKFSKRKEEFIMSKQETVVQDLQDKNAELSQEVKDLEAKLSTKEADFKTQIEDLKLEHQQEVLSLTQEKDAIKAQLDEASTELAAFRAEAEKEAEAALAAKKEELVELAKALSIEHTVEDIDDMSEDFIDRQIKQLTELKEKYITEKESTHVKQYKSEQHQPHEGGDEERKPFSGLGNFFGTKVKGD